jgi:hypothetical protein
VELLKGSDDGILWVGLLDFWTLHCIVFSKQNNILEIDPVF